MPRALTVAVRGTVAGASQPPAGGAPTERVTAGVEAAPGAPDELAAYIRSDMSRMGKVIRDAGIRLDN